MLPHGFAAYTLTVSYDDLQAPAGVPFRVTPKLETTSSHVLGLFPETNVNPCAAQISLLASRCAEAAASSWDVPSQVPWVEGVNPGTRKCRDVSRLTPWIVVSHCRSNPSLVGRPS